MPKTPDNNYEDLITRLGAVALECKTAIRQAHEATRDVRQAMKEYRQLMEGGVAEQIGIEVKAQIDELGAHTQNQMRLTTQKIMREFEGFAEPLMRSFEDMHEAQVKLMEEIAVSQGVVSGKTGG